MNLLIPITKKNTNQPILHHEELHFFNDYFPSLPLHTIHTVEFYKLTPMANLVDTSKVGRVHFWAKVKNELQGVLVICLMSEPNTIYAIHYYMYERKWVDVGDGQMKKTEAMDDEMFEYCLTGFVRQYLSLTFSFEPIKY